MPSQTGSRFECSESGSQYMVTKGGDADLSCKQAEDGQADQLGKRYIDNESGIMVLCTKSGSSNIYCNDRRMELVASRTLPSSD
ncbi:MAG: hypothetical protein CL763_03495 [Chloroflexi bacterium]|nr:hypothetical protein [Chloroflexota bacterium]|tara:strand:+ start:1398 stop:1649 length:252 start_codon:yes stop_codon:yes gene_type:complete